MHLQTILLDITIGANMSLKGSDLCRLHHRETLQLLLGTPMRHEMILG